MKKYPKYKPSDVEWIGEIPEAWDCLNLKFILRENIKDGPHETPVWFESGIPFLSIDGIVNGEISFNNCRYIDKEQFEKFSKKLVIEIDDIFLGKAASIGKIARVKTDTEFTVWSPIAVIKVNKEKCSPIFVEYFFKSDIIQYQIEIFSTSNTQKNIAMGDIPKMKFISPSLKEQNQIAKYLDYKTNQIETLIANKQKLIELLQEERTSIINHAVTKGLNPKAKLKPSGIEWLGDISESWEVKPLKYLIKELLSGVSVNSTDASVLDNEELGILKTSCVYDYTFRHEENKQVIREEYDRVKCPVTKDSIIISRMNTPELVGASGCVDKDYPNLFLPDRLWKTEFFDNIELDVQWLSLVLVSDLYKKTLSSRATGTSPSMKNISKDDLLTLPIPYPPYKEQNQIANFITKEQTRIDTIIVKTEQEIELMKEYKTALISEVVTGKVDVRDEVIK